MYSVQGLDQDTVNKVLDEFLEIIKQQTSLGLGSDSYIRNVLTKALGTDKAQSVLGRITPTSSNRPIEILDWMDARAIAEMVLDEHPQIISLIISYLEPSVGADVMNMLPVDLQADVIRRVATLETVQPDALRELEMVMQQKFAANTSLRASQVGGVKAAAALMNFTQQDTEQRIMKVLGKDDKDLMQAIQENMFLFENLIESDDRSLQTLLRSVETEDIVVAMKGADEALRDKLFACMSSRVVAIAGRDGSPWPGALTEVQDAQKAIINVARRLSDEGAMVFKPGRGGDDFV